MTGWYGQYYGIFVGIAAARGIDIDLEIGYEADPISLIRNGDYQGIIGMALMALHASLGIFRKRV